jgi:hypothetical protein
VVVVAIRAFEKGNKRAGLSTAIVSYIVVIRRAIAGVRAITLELASEDEINGHP